MAEACPRRGPSLLASWPGAFIGRPQMGGTSLATPRDLSMLRLTELKLPLDHPPDALREAVLARLAIPPDDLLA